MYNIYSLMGEREKPRK